MNRRSFSFKALYTVTPSLAALVLIVSVLYLAPRGFDFTDDAFYFLSAREPESFLLVFSLFGYLLKPLLYLSDQNIAAYRQIGILFLCATSALAWYPWWSRSDNQQPHAQLTKVATALLIAAMPLFYYAYWLPTPSYNWLALLAGLLLFGALGSLARSDGVIAPAMFAGSSGVVALFAKPTAAIAYALIYLLALLVGSRSPRIFFRYLVVSAMTTGVFIVLAFTFLVPMDRAIESHQAFIELIIRPGYDYQTGQILRAFSELLLNRIGYPISLSILVYMLAMAHRAWPTIPFMRSMALGGVVLVALLDFTLLGMKPWRAWAGVLVPSFAALFLALSMLSSQGRMDIRANALLGLALLIPAGAVAATSSPLDYQLLFFAPVAALVIIEAARHIRLRGFPILSPVAIALLGFLAVLLFVAEASPYRIATPLRFQTERLEIAPKHGTLFVDVETKHFIESLRMPAIAVGLKVGDPIFDLSARNPGLVLALGGNPPTMPWLFRGDVPASDSILAFVMSNTSVEVRRKGWLIWGDVPFTFSREAIKKLNFDLDLNYRCVSRATHPISGGTICIYSPINERD